MAEVLTCRALVKRRGHAMTTCGFAANRGYSESGPFHGLCTQHAELLRQKQKRGAARFQRGAEEHRPR